MKKKLAFLLAAVLLVSCFCTVGAAAAPDAELTVKVNGVTVSFPDGQPYIDTSDRTMIPVRFVTEELGAAVSWTGETRTATIEKDDIRVDITIGSPILKVTQGSITRTVTMDTAAVLKHDRTYVPIRFVAEALGAFVDYSDVYRTVGIFDEVLTAEQQEMLQALPYTQPDYAVGYETAKARFSADDLSYYYGTDRDSFGVFANAREHLYRTMARSGKYVFKGLGLTLQGSDTDTFYRKVAEEAASEIAYASEHMTVEFLTDTSCIYQADNMDRVTCAVRGLACVTLFVSPLELTGEEIALLVRLGFTQLYSDTVMMNPVDVHMNTQPNYQVNIHSIVPVGEAC